MTGNMAIKFKIILKIYSLHAIFSWSFIDIITTCMMPMIWAFLYGDRLLNNWNKIKKTAWSHSPKITAVSTTSLPIELPMENGDSPVNVKRGQTRKATCRIHCRGFHKYPGRPVYGTAGHTRVWDFELRPFINNSGSKNKVVCLLSYPGVRGL